MLPHRTGGETAQPRGDSNPCAIGKAAHSDILLIVTEHRAGDRLVDAAVARHPPCQQFERVGADLGEIVQLELDEQRRVGVSGGRGVTLHHQAADPAAAVVFQSADGLDDLLLLQRIIEAADAVPAAPQRPLAGEIHLADASRAAGQRMVARITVAGVQHLGEVRLPARPDDEALGLAIARIVLPGSIPIGARHDTAGQRREEVRGAARTRRFARQRDMLLGEVIALPNHAAHVLLSALRIDQPRGQRGGQLVGVGDAIDAGIDVVGKDGAEIEIHQARIENGNLVLRTLRHQQIEQPRLQRLGQPLAEPVEAAFEGEPGIDAENRQVAHDGVGADGGLPLEIVARRVQADFRREMPGRRLQRQRQLRIQRQAATDVERGVIEVHVFAGEGEGRPAEELRPVRNHGDLRQALIGLDHGRQGRVLQRLVGLHVHRGRAPPAAVVQHALAQQVALRGLGDARAEVAQVGAVRNAAEIQQAAEAMPEVGMQVQDRIAVAIAVFQAVVRQPLDARLPLISIVQVAELAIDLQAPLGHQARRNGHVHVRRNVPVVGQRELDA